ncbi:ROK family protein [Bacteroides pyogenes]|uniref:ROK family protein n=1 Tax=Bacteroides pyogenes TaxID=310300 RepID=UPI003B43452D
MEKQIIIGVDLGGTKIMTGAINRDGKVLGTPVRVATEGTRPKEVIFDKIVTSVEKVMQDNGITTEELKGIGIGSTGPLDSNEGLILECPQLPTMHFFPLKDELSKRLGVPVLLNNDANCLILGEAVFGVGRGKQRIAGFTLGTGIGCALVFDGKIWNGATGTAGEIWCSPYAGGMIEDFISGHGVSALYRSVAGKEASSLEIFKLAEQGDKEALDTWVAFGRHLAVPLSWTINIIDPETVILGGSIAGAYRYFGEAMEAELRRNICPVPAEQTPVVLSTLGDKAGFVGAACLMLT